LRRHLTLAGRIRGPRQAERYLLYRSATSVGPALAVAFYLELDNCIGSVRLSPLAMSLHRGWVACGHKRTENSVKVASHRFGVFWQFSFARRASVT
jgi:hypothetical protein